MNWRGRGTHWAQSKTWVICCDAVQEWDFHWAIIFGNWSASWKYWRIEKLQMTFSLYSEKILFLSVINYLGLTTTISMNNDGQNTFSETSKRGLKNSHAASNILTPNIRIKLYNKNNTKLYPCWQFASVSSSFQILQRQVLSADVSH